MRFLPECIMPAPTPRKPGADPESSGLLYLGVIVGLVLLNAALISVGLPIALAILGVVALGLLAHWAHKGYRYNPLWIFNRHLVGPLC
jgi:hypothetical protein